MGIPKRTLRGSFEVVRHRNHWCTRDVWRVHTHRLAQPSRRRWVNCRTPTATTDTPATTTPGWASTSKPCPEEVPAGGDGDAHRCAGALGSVQQPHQVLLGRAAGQSQKDPFTETHELHLEVLLRGGNQISCRAQHFASPVWTAKTARTSICHVPPSSVLFPGRRQDRCDRRYKAPVVSSIYRTGSGQDYLAAPLRSEDPRKGPRNSGATTHTVGSYTGDCVSPGVVPGRCVGCVSAGCCWDE